MITSLFSTTKTNKVGVYEISFYVSGTRNQYIIDDRLPMKKIELLEKTKVKQIRDTMTSRGCNVIDNGELLTPAFCAAGGNFIWASLVEKAYAKAYGNYKILTGGWVREAFYDLLGCPFEQIQMIDLSHDAREDLWTKLKSFSDSKFVMGLSCSFRLDKEENEKNMKNDLVFGHAYSLICVEELFDVKVGKQQKMTNFFSGQVVKKR